MEKAAADWRHLHSLADPLNHRPVADAPSNPLQTPRALDKEAKPRPPTTHPSPGVLYSLVVAFGLDKGRQCL